MGYARGILWDDATIEKHLLMIIHDRNMKTFPTHREMTEFFGTLGVSEAVSKHGGTKYWASRLGLPIKKCDSSFGDKYELIAIDDIKQTTGLDARQTIPRYPYDILIENNIKVDVKASRQRFTNMHCWQNNFELAKRDPTCDIFILYCLTCEGEPIKTLVVPSCVVTGQRSIGVGDNSKWNVYKDNWSLITKYEKFYKELMGDSWNGEKENTAP